MWTGSDDNTREARTGEVTGRSRGRGPGRYLKREEMGSDFMCNEERRITDKSLVVQLGVGLEMAICN